MSRISSKKEEEERQRRKKRQRHHKEEEIEEEEIEEEESSMNFVIAQTLFSSSSGAFPLDPSKDRPGKSSSFHHTHNALDFERAHLFPSSPPLPTHAAY